MAFERGDEEQKVVNVFFNIESILKLKLANNNLLSAIVYNFQANISVCFARYWLGREVQDGEFI